MSIENISAADWRQKAEEELTAARVLASAGLWQQSFQHAGFAVECALKFRIMRGTGLNRWPDRAERKDLYSHDLQKLAHLAQIESAMLAALARSEPLGLCWLVAKDWTNEIRYDPRPFPAARGRDMLFAVDTGGLVVWLLQS